VESHVTHHGQARAGELLYVTTRIKQLDDKRVRLLHELHRRSDAALLASAEQLYLHVNSAVGKAAPFGAALHERLSALQAATR
jgi:acyl-CoA thioesterase FadM